MSRALPLLSLAAGSLPEFPPATVARAAAATGWQGSGIWYDDQAWSTAGETETTAVLRGEGLVPLDIEVLWLQPGDTGDEAAHRRLVDAGGRLGARNVLVVTSQPDPGEQAAAFAAVCGHAAAAGMRAMLEFLQITALRSLPAALAVVRAAGHPAGGVLVDALHLDRCGGTPADVAALDPALLPYAQFCDGAADAGGTTFEDWLADAVDRRSAPGEGVLPLPDLLRALPPATPLSIEVRSAHYRSAWPDPVARAAALHAATVRWLGRLPPDTGAP